MRHGFCLSNLSVPGSNPAFSFNSGAFLKAVSSTACSTLTLLTKLNSYSQLELNIKTKENVFSLW
jgi:hypothetical protein